VCVLRFRLFRIPVTIQGSFLLIAALLGFQLMEAPLFWVSWVLIVFVSILIHELGHAFTARAYGAKVAIELNGLGGLTRWAIPGGGVLPPGRRAIVAGAGSFAGIVLGLLVALLAATLGPFQGLAAFIMSRLIYVNLFWGLLNWLPIRPLDGGHLFMSLLEKISPNRATAIAKVVFTLTAGAALLYAVLAREYFIVILAGWLLFMELGARSTPVPALAYDDGAVPAMPEPVEASGDARDVDSEQTAPAAEPDEVDG
jgi:Zn-dependent protease